MNTKLAKLEQDFNDLRQQMAKITETVSSLDKQAEAKGLCLDCYPWNTTTERWKTSLARWGYHQLKGILGEGRPFVLPSQLLANPEGLRREELDRFITTFAPVQIGERFQTEQGGISGQEHIQAIQEFKLAFINKTPTSPNKKGQVEVYCYLTLVEKSLNAGHSHIYRSSSSPALSNPEKFELLVRFFFATATGKTLNQVSLNHTNMPSWWVTLRAGQEVPNHEIYHKSQLAAQLAFRIKANNYVAFWLPETVWRHLKSITP
jgi:hypothetical protein